MKNIIELNNKEIDKVSGGVGSTIAAMLCATFLIVRISEKGAVKNISNGFSKIVTYVKSKFTSTPTTTSTAALTNCTCIGKSFTTISVYSPSQCGVECCKFPGVHAWRTDGAQGSC